RNGHCLGAFVSRPLTHPRRRQPLGLYRRPTPLPFRSKARQAGENVGSYAITQGTLAVNTDYVLHFTGKTLTVTPATLQVTADAQTKLFGESDPTLTYTTSGFRFADTAAGVLSGQPTRAVGETVGTYAISQG